MLYIIGILSYLFHISKTATITGISTVESTQNEYNKKGSDKGGTILYFHAAFSFGDPSQYTAYVGEKECKIIEYHSDSSLIQCIVPASDTDHNLEHLISLVSSSEKISFSSYVDLTFSYDYDRTP